ncbi:MAG: hypothetical protein QOJ27_2734 [Sphingomonadales bacterium]|nr:hypothetical protein [Sphingomonadales bacterium]
MLAPRRLALLLLAAATPAVAQQSLGVFGLWVAFRTPERCYAIAEPEEPGRAGDGAAYASVGYWPQRGLRGQAYFRFRQPKRAGSAVLLRIDDRTFQLRGGGTGAWTADAAADAEIVAAMRTGIEMTIQTRAGNGALLRDSYPLRGAATAIDAAAIACARRP